MTWAMFLTIYIVNSLLPPLVFPLLCGWGDRKKEQGRESGKLLKNRFEGIGESEEKKLEQRVEEQQQK